MADKPFAFRMPVEMKVAASTLARTQFSEWQDEQKFARGVYIDSINDALIYLVRTGMRHASSYLEVELQNRQTQYDRWQVVVKYFLENPSETKVSAADFPEGSDVRNWLVDVSSDEDDCNTTRQEAYNYLAHLQQELTHLFEAYSALRKVAA